MKEICGCGCHELNLENDIVLYEKQQWNPICALKETIRNLAIKNESFKKLETEHDILLNKIQNLICPNCFGNVKDKWIIAEGTIYCSDCLDEIYPII